jgi:hypothetical protein
MSYMEEKALYDRDRPMADAAEEVKALAAKGREMLDQVQRSRIWAWLFTSKPQIPNE